MSDITHKLFQPITLGDMKLNHRVVLAPLTRCRADDHHVPLPHVAEYYSQRASVPGTLLIAEGTLISAKAGGFPNVPGIYSDDQIAAWKKITDAVHAKDSFIYLQIYAVGRVADPHHLKEEDPSFTVVGPSAIGLKNSSVIPRPLTVSEIKEYVQMHATAAENAVFKAGFDGVEIHCGNGYLLDQFLQDVSNQRDDEYGGSIENRVRIALEITSAVVKAVGEKKTGLRITPWSRFQDMRMDDPLPTFAYLATQLRKQHPDLAYLHVVEPRIDGSKDSVVVSSTHESNDLLREIWGADKYLSAGGHTRESGIKTADEKGGLVVYGRSFLANPDLPFRLQHDIPITKGNRATYYGAGSLDPTGYTTYPFSAEFLRTQSTA